MLVGIIEANVHAALDAEKDQVARLQIARRDALAHLQQFGGGDAIHRQIKAIFQRAPDKAGAVDAGKFGAAPLILRAVPGMHLIVQCGNDRNEIALIALAPIADLRIVLCGGISRMARAAAKQKSGS